MTVPNIFRLGPEFRGRASRPQIFFGGQPFFPRAMDITYVSRKGWRIQGEQGQAYFRDIVAARERKDPEAIARLQEIEKEEVEVKVARVIMTAESVDDGVLCLTRHIQANQPQSMEKAIGLATAIFRHVDRSRSIHPPAVYLRALAHFLYTADQRNIACFSMNVTANVWGSSDLAGSLFIAMRKSVSREGSSLLATAIRGLCNAVNLGFRGKPVLQGEIIGYFSFHFVPPLAVIVPVSYGVEGSTVDKAVVFANALKVRGIKLSVAKIRDHAHSVVGDAPSEIAMFVQIVTGYVFPSPGGVC